MLYSALWGTMELFVNFMLVVIFISSTGVNGKATGSVKKDLKSPSTISPKLDKRYISQGDPALPPQCSSREKFWLEI